jgi:hypothetical protein
MFFFFPFHSYHLLLTIAGKCAVEQFLSSVKHSAVPDTNFMLLSNGTDKSCLLSTFGEPLMIFETALKNMEVKPGNKDISYPIGLALSTINKYRMKNLTDRFGFGRLPW